MKPILNSGETKLESGEKSIPNKPNFLHRDKKKYIGESHG